MRDKVELFELIESYEKIEFELSKWHPETNLSEEALALIGSIKSYEDQKKSLNFIRRLIKDLHDKKSKSDGKMYLSEIIKEDNVAFKTNNLILAPVGSGKTHFIKSLIEEGSHVLLLVSTTSLKRKMIPIERSKRKELSNRMYSTKNKEVYGEGTHKILVMTYAEFGERVNSSVIFSKQFDKIFCDEIHSLPLYQNYSKSIPLALAIRELFTVNEKQQKFYFTATTEHLDNLRKNTEGIMDELLIINYLEDERIKRYMPLSSYKIKGIEQVRPHIQSRKESFKYFGYKMFAFCKTIESQLRLKKICEEEGLTAQAYWSVNNEDKVMSEEQIKEMYEMLNSERLPNKYDVVIINSALQEGWDLKDHRVKLAIINTTNETEYTQSLGRIRNDIDILVYKASESEQKDPYIDFPHELLEKPLDVNEKRKLCRKFNITDNNGRLYGWTVIERMLEKQGFTIVSKQIVIDGKRKRVSIVHAK